MNCDEANKLQKKLENHAIHCRWLRYDDSHAIDIYHVLNLKTRQVMLTQDAFFMKKLYFHEEKDNKQEGKIGIKNTVEEKTNAIKEKTKTKDSDKDDESTAGDPNIPVVSNNEDDENKNNQDEIGQKCYIQHLCQIY